MTKSQGNSKGNSQDESQAYYAHPTAIVESESIGEGTKIWHFAHVRPSSKIGKGCNIGKSVYIDIGAEVGDNVKIQNFVSVYKGVKIEDDVFVGPSATFTNDLYPRAFIWDEEHVLSYQDLPGVKHWGQCHHCMRNNNRRVCHDRSGKRGGRGRAIPCPDPGQSGPAEGLGLPLRPSSEYDFA